MKKLIFILSLMVAFYSTNAQDVTTLRVGSVDSKNLQVGDVVEVPVFFDNLTEVL